MFQRDFVIVFGCGFILGVCVCAAIAGWIWTNLTEGWSGKPTNEQRDRKLIENMIEEETHDGQ